ncbi:hypothetical protein M0804_000272 [Polistes exclamans]|nr:hypothetical protein M0804_000272 [Polistes exclamans]
MTSNTYERYIEFNKDAEFEQREWEEEEEKEEEEEEEEGKKKRGTGGGYRVETGHFNLGPVAASRQFSWPVSGSALDREARDLPHKSDNAVAIRKPRM